MLAKNPILLEVFALNTLFAELKFITFDEKSGEQISSPSLTKELVKDKEIFPFQD